MVIDYLAFPLRVQTTITALFTCLVIYWRNFVPVYLLDYVTWPTL